MSVRCLSLAEQHVIKRMYMSTHMTQAQVAAHFGVAPSTVNKVLNEMGLTSSYKKTMTEEDSLRIKLLDEASIDYATLKDILNLWNPQESV